MSAYLLLCFILSAQMQMYSSCLYTSSMSPKNPDWLPEVRDFCRRSSITVSGWGADTLVVEAKSPDQAAQASSLLSQFGFQPMPDDDDKNAGVLLLSRNPGATRAKQVAIDISRRPLAERVASLFETLIPILFFWYSARLRPPASGWFVALGALAVIAILWDISRIWTWRLEIFPEELRVRRNFRWNGIPWQQIQSMDMEHAVRRGGDRVLVRLTLVSNATFRLGVFRNVFASALHDRLRSELSQRRPDPHSSSN